MKKALLLITAIFLVFGGCKKDVVPEATKVQIEKETIEKGSNYVKISAEYEYPEVLTSVILYLSEKEDMSDVLTFKCDIDEKIFRVTADGLKAGTKYHYYYGFSIGYYNEKSEKSEITTLEETFETQTITVNGVSFTMIAVEGGTFQMGATSEQGGDAYDNEYPVHSVTLSDYYIGETEVTQELWEAVMVSNPSYFSGSQRPVERVSWNDCQEFITQLNQLTGKNFRLPTEAEWEYAARGGDNSQGYKYSGSNTIGNVAWYCDNSNSQTHNVKTKSPDELGIYDMSGNVLEWCQDWYGNYSSGSQTNPTGPSSGSYRVGRGAGWDGIAAYCRVSCRDGISPGSRYYFLGLRLCLSQ